VAALSVREGVDKVGLFIYISIAAMKETEPTLTVSICVEKRLTHFLHTNNGQPSNYSPKGKRQSLDSIKLECRAAKLFQELLFLTVKLCIRKLFKLTLTGFEYLPRVLYINIAKQFTEEN